MKITAIVPQQRAEGRYSIYVDGSFVFGLSDSAVLSSRITKDQDITADELQKLKKLSDDDKLYWSVLGYLAIRSRSEWEVSTYMTRKGATKELITEVIERLRRNGLVDDRMFATSWVANRRLLKTISRRKLTVELQQKHISQDVIAEVLSEDKEATDERSVLRDLVARKRARYPDRQKFMQFLARQGFNYDDIKAVLSEEAEDL